ncbi:MAG: helix-turn-helix domain-containing protein [Candidatus Pelethousia sp.]|nr:helix-turn-helix domain-containing protein [Candidatus Pelethousia sp.]
MFEPLLRFCRQRNLARAGDTEAVEQVLRYYEGYTNKLCTRTLYDDYGQPRVRLDEHMKYRLEIKLIHAIVTM